MVEEFTATTCHCCHSDASVCIVLTENKILTVKFRKLHAHLVGQNLSSVMDELYSQGIISIDDMEDLGEIVNNKDRNRRLMFILNKSGNDKTFVVLRSAMEMDKAHSWIIKKLDNMEVDLENEEQEETASAASESPHGIKRLCLRHCITKFV